MSGSSDESVAQKIASQLGQKQLVPDAKLNDILRGLRAGTLRLEDWRLYAEMSLDAQGKKRDG